MKEGWEYKKLGEVCEIYQPQTIASNLLKKDGKYPVFGANGMIGRYDSYNHEEPEVLLCCRGATCGAINVSFPFSWINGNAMVVKPINDSYLKAFLRYLLLTLDYSHIITGAAQPQITRKSLSPVTVPVPPLPEQQSIVDYLDSAFAKIDAMKANAEKALNEAKALFQASLKEMLEPKEGWEEKKVGDVAEIKGGKRLPKGEKLLTEPTNHMYIRVADFNEYGTVDLDDIQYISDKVYEQIKRYIIKKEDIYISIAGTIGKSGIVPEELDGANLTENACRLILSRELNQRFMYYITISPEFIRQEMESTKISAQPKLALTRLADILIAFPPLSEQQSIVATLDSLKSKVDRLQANYEKISQECDALKQAILRQVFE